MNFVLDRNTAIERNTALKDGSSNRPISRKGAEWTKRV